MLISRETAVAPEAPSLPAEDVVLLRRILRRPALDLPADLTARLGALLNRIDAHRPEDREALRGDLSDMSDSVAQAPPRNVRRDTAGDFGISGFLH